MWLIYMDYISNSFEIEFIYQTIHTFVVYNLIVLVCSECNHHNQVYISSPQTETRMH